MQSFKRKINIPEGSTLKEPDYLDFLTNSAELMSRFHQYFAPSEGLNSVELAHIIPDVPETIIALYVGINDATCNKALVTSFLVRHAHNNVFVFDPNVYPGGQNVPEGTADARLILNGFEPPNNSWPAEWTYVMIRDPKRSFESLWKEKGYIDMIAAKFEDFTMLSDPAESSVCCFVDSKAFDHPVNMSRDYLKDARKRGELKAHEYAIPKGLEGEEDGLVPVILNRGEKLYIATPHFGPCEHSWSNIHPANKNYAVINENSAVPLELVIRKPQVAEKYIEKLIPAKGSADMTTDWFHRGLRVVRKPLIEGAVRG